MNFSKCFFALVEDPMHLSSAYVKELLYAHSHPIHVAKFIYTRT